MRLTRHLSITVGCASAATACLLVLLPGVETALVSGIAATLWAAAYMFFDPKGAVHYSTPLFSIIAGCHVILLVYMVALPGFMSDVAFWFSMSIIATSGVGLIIVEKAPPRHRHCRAKA